MVSAVVGQVVFAVFDIQEWSSPLEVLFSVLFDIQDIAFSFGSFWFLDLLTAGCFGVGVLGFLSKIWRLYRDQGTGGIAPVGFVFITNGQVRSNKAIKFKKSRNSAGCGKGARTLRRQLLPPVLLQSYPRCSC